ncbi:MAG: 2-hydroxycarboxylate transporter family protein [Firmicutes bacterium]|nr:2-hydroxycarboxylate transporter family protein [Bacillota bacterium]
MENIRKWKICGMPPLVFAVVCGLTILLTATGSLPKDITGSMLFLFSIGGLLSFVGEHTPFVGKWLGGAMLVPMLVGSLLVHLQIIPSVVTEQVTGFMTLGPINILLCSAIAGSILSLDKDTLKKAAITILPSVLIVQLCSFGALFLGSLVAGKTFFEGVYMVGLPNFCGGSTSSIGAIPALYAERFGESPLTYSGRFMVYLNISNVLSIVFAGILHHIGKKAPRLTGRGQLLKTRQGLDHQEKTSSPATPEQYLAGCLVSLALYGGGVLLSKYLPFLNAPAWMIVICVIVKIANLLDERICGHLQSWYSVMMKLLVPGLMFGMGISSISISGLMECLSVANVWIILTGILGGLAGSLLVSKWFHYYPIDAMIALGCNNATFGSSGTIGVLSASDRMELMPYASIMLRIGGALMLVLLTSTVQLFM